MTPRSRSRPNAGLPCSCRRTSTTPSSRPAICSAPRERPPPAQRSGRRTVRRRRIDEANRLVHIASETHVTILQARYHY
ncbi:hypothetical protein E4V99_11570 [Microbacterium sp. dk485]|nr:hypothetical protein E4V99_11570 [Microbacterium sp. dk485]